MFAMVSQSELANLSPCNSIIVPPSGHDDTSAIQSAIDAVTAAGIAGTVYLTEGLYWVSKITIKSLIHLRGLGREVTKIKRLPGANTSAVIESSLFDEMDAAGNYSAENQGAGGGVKRISLMGLTIDGNRQQNSAGRGVQLYGAGFYLVDIGIENCNTDGLYTGFNGVDVFADISYSLESRYNDLRIKACGSTGWINHGPHDSVVTNLLIYGCAVDGWDVQSPIGAFAANTYGIGRRGIWCHEFGLINGSNIVGCGGETGILFESSGSVIAASAAAGHVGIHVKGNHIIFQGEIANTTEAALRLSGNYGSGRFDLLYAGNNTGIWVDNQQSDINTGPSEITIVSAGSAGTLFNANAQPVPLGRVTVRAPGKYGVFENAPA